MKPLKFLAYTLYVIGAILEPIGIFIIVEDVYFGSNFKPTGLPWEFGLCVCLLSIFNIIGFKLIQLRFFPPKDKD